MVLRRIEFSHIIEVLAKSGRGNVPVARWRRIAGSEDAAPPGGGESRAARTLDPSAKGNGKSGSWLRGNFTFLQHVPVKGEYPIAFRIGRVGARKPYALVTVKGPDGKKVDGFWVRQEEGFVYRLAAASEGVYSFDVFTFGHVVAVDSPFPGQGFEAAKGISPMNRLNGRPHRYWFRVPAGAEDVAVQVVAAKGEPLETRLIAPDGKVAARVPRRDGGFVLRTKRQNAPSAAGNRMDSRFFRSGHVPPVK